MSWTRRCNRVARAVARPMMGTDVRGARRQGRRRQHHRRGQPGDGAAAAASQPTLLIDLHLAHGDAAVFLGVEPRFSVLDALENIHRLDETYLKGLVTADEGRPGSARLLEPPPARARSTRRACAALIEFATTPISYVVLDCPRADATMLEAIDAASHGRRGRQPGADDAAQRQPDRQPTCGSAAATERVKVAISRFDPQSDISSADVERVLGGPVNYVFPSDYRAAVAAPSIAASR